MNPKQQEPHVVKIGTFENPVRLSYPYLFTPQEQKNDAGQLTGKKQYAAVFLMDKVKNKPDIDRLTAAALHVKKRKWQDTPVNLAGRSIRDGLEKEATEGYGPSIMFISARSDTKPGIVDGKLRDLTAESGKPYAGCYVIATVHAWTQDNKNGKRINWTLRNVQFVRDGEPFGERRAAATDEFTELPDDTGNVDSGTSAQSKANLLDQI